MEPALYGLKDARNEAMRWACLKGNLAVIRGAVSYGASVSTIALDPTRCRYWDGKNRVYRPAKVLTLYLAARHHHVDAFKLLLEFGAQVDDADVYLRCLNLLMKHLCLPENWVLLRLFLEAGLDSQVRVRHCPQVALPLIPIVRSEPLPLDLVRLLLDRGANPNWVHSCGSSTFISPLSAAITANSTALCNLLLARGADINGTDVDRPSNRPQHIPVFAAALTMAKHGLGMMQLCLDNGADINRRSRVIKWYPDIKWYTQYYYTTPLLVYLDSIDSWEADADFRPVDGLTYLLEHGASVELGEVPNTRDAGWYSWVKTPSSIELLLDKWGLAQLAVLEFFATVQFLVQCGGAREHTSKLLLRYDWRIQPGNSMEPGKSELERMAVVWQGFLTVLLQDQQIDINRLLSQFILDKGKGQEELGDLGCATIRRLVAAGADINARIKPDGPTALHELCRVYNRRERWRDHWLDHLNWRYTPQQKRLLFSFLVSQGVDPFIMTGGQTAIDVLTADLEHMEEDGQACVLSLATILRGESVN